MNPNPDPDLNRVAELCRSGRLKEAETVCRAILTRYPADPRAHSRLADIAFRMGNNEDALRHARQAVAAAPNQPEYLEQLGRTCTNLGRATEGFQALHRALSITPNHVATHITMAGLLRSLGRYGEALKHARTAMRLAPHSAYAQQGVGDVLYAIGHYATALKSYQRALSLKPDLVQAYCNVASIQQARGNREDAIRSFRKAIEINPSHVQAYWRLAQLEKATRGDKRFRILERLSKEGHLDTRAGSRLHFALGKMYADIGDHDQSFANYKRANELRHQLRNSDFSIQKVREIFDLYRELFAPSRLQILPRSTVNSQRPIFVVAMPRSGTTLVEQIIGAHSRAAGAGELQYIESIRNSLLQGNDPRTLPTVLPTLSPERLSHMANRYLDGLPESVGAASRVVDKMPRNFEHLWLIALLFPQARVIHVVRDPLDTCWSCYVTDFANAHVYRDDLRLLGQYFVEYWKLMAFWKQTLPLRFLTVSYEDLVCDPETEVRRLIEFAGLEWEDAVLRFHESREAVATASNVQVRQKMYTSSINRWKPYEKYLEPLIEELEGAGLDGD